MFRGGIASFGTRSRATIWVAPTGLVCFLSGLPRPVAWAFSLCAVGAAGKKRCQSSLLTVGEHWDGSCKRFDGRRSGAAWMFRGGIASFGTRSRPTIWVAPTGLVCFLSGLPRPVAWAFSLCAVGAAGKKRCQSSLLTVEEHWDGSRRRFDDRRSGTVKMVRGGIAAF